MEIFYSKEFNGEICLLGQEESNHCVKVMRHRCGDEISVMDGCGTLYRCRILSDSPKQVQALILGSMEGWGSRPYRLHLAVAPTKNSDRYEWFVEKACELGVDRITPVIGEHSERKVFKTARIEKIAVSAAKQSLKAYVPQIDVAVGVSEFISETEAASGAEGKEKILKLIACCFEDGNNPRRSIKEVLDNSGCNDIIVLIGPEGDFSVREVETAVRAGFIPVHLGPSRLRTETAAVTAAEAVYFKYI